MYAINVLPHLSRPRCEKWYYLDLYLSPALAITKVKYETQCQKIYKTQ